MLDDRKRKWFDRIAWTMAVAILGVLIEDARAADHRYAVDNATYRSECGSCHVAYPPPLLDAGAWREIMRGLDRHFGTDASLGEAAQAQIDAYLGARAGRSASPASTLRITEATWFRKEHRKIGEATWKSPSVKSTANCSACHWQAEQGDFSERSLRVSRGR